MRQTIYLNIKSNDDQWYEDNRENIHNFCEDVDGMSVCSGTRNNLR